MTPTYQLCFRICC